MPKNPLWTLDQSGATDGQVPTWDQSAMGGDGEWVPGDGPSSAPALGWFNVKDPAYGAVGDYDRVAGTGTDDTAAINAAIAALNTNAPNSDGYRGTLYFPGGNYLTTSDMTAVTARAVIVGEGAGDAYDDRGGTLIWRKATTGVPLTLSAHGCTVTRIGFVNPTTITQTAGSAIRVTAGDRMKLVDVSVYGFYDCINIEDGGEWEATGLWLVGPVRYGLYVRHIDSPDGGDQSLTKSWIYAKDRNASAAIRYESGGGLKINTLKINDYGGTGRFSVGIDANFAVQTANLIINGSSFENVSGPYIKGRVSGTGSFTGLSVNGCQFAYYTSVTSAAIDVDGFTNVNIIGNPGFARFGGSTQPLVKLANVTTGFVGGNSHEGFAGGEVSLTSCTGVDTLSASVPSSRQIATDSTLTGGGDLSADRTLGVDTTAELERIQDAVGAMVVPGSNITATYNDTAGTLTIASTASGGGGEALMQDGVTGPPVPIENEARTDWLYAG